MDDRLRSEQFPRASQYHPDWVVTHASGGANSLWLTEWIAGALDLRPGMRVLDLGCGRACSSIFLRREFGVQVWATDLNVGRGTLRQARGTAEIIGRPTCLTVLGGDMNAGPGSPEDQVLRTHLADVWRAVGRGPGHTNLRGIQRIDYLYHRHTTPVRAWVTPLRASDHRGVVGIVRLHRARSC